MKGKVLVVDDHEVTRRGIREILHDAFDEVQVFEAEDPEDALGQLNETWDLILLDICMPGSNVLDLLGRIRSANRTVPVLVLTALNEVEYVVQTMKAGANGLIHKHRAADELVGAIEKVASGGTYLHPDTAIAIATSLREEKPVQPHEKLSAREHEIFCLIARGRAVKEIAAHLGISDKTVATYLARIREKTGLTSHVEIARYALQKGLVL
jgi:DNA-binding NarL/FixJ family response regulator